METTYTTTKGTIMKRDGDNVRIVLQPKRDDVIVYGKCEALPPYMVKAFEKAGMDTSDYKCAGGVAVELGAATWIDAQIDEIKKEQDTPANRAKINVDKLYAKVEGLRDYPYEYHLALEKAEKAEKQYREEYPESAKEDDDKELLVAADEMDRKAGEALGFSADGGLTEEQRQQSSDEYRAKAKELRDKASQ